MAVKVIIRRIVPEDRIEDLEPLLKQLRTLATLQPGYISGETLQRIDKPDEFLIIGTWESTEHWNKWAKCQERNEVQGRIDTMLAGKTEYGIFHHGFSKPSPDS